MYTCGPTVWNFPHIGNYRTFLFEDLLRRFLKYSGFKVIQVMNITDVDDRIIKMCRDNSLDLYEFTERYTKAFFEDLDFLGIERAEVYPRATMHVPEMVRIIEGLLDKGIAYRSEDGSIYYSIVKFPSYGRLSGLKLGELKAGARVRQDDYGKDSAQDFALWKAWDKEDGKIFWETSVGKGRPGWHIECSAMSIRYLGEQFDIHTGGVDNIFPHHENEIAQSEGFTGRKFVNYWLHSEHLLINETKMAKRLGNFITIQDMRDRKVDGQALRFTLLAGHYRTQLNFTDKSLEQSVSSLKRIAEFSARLEEAKENAISISEEDQAAIDLVKKTRERYLAALQNDLDTPTATAAVFEINTEGNRILDTSRMGKEAVNSMIDFISRDINNDFGVIKPASREISTEASLLLKEREDARRMKDWARSDLLRKKLLELGVEVQDTSDGQKWRNA